MRGTATFSHSAGLLVAGLLASGTGCSTPPDAPAAMAPARAAPVETTTAAAVADQAERDIETLLALRRGSADASSSSTDLPEPAPAADTGSSAIIWTSARSSAVWARTAMGPFDNSA